MDVADRPLLWHLLEGPCSIPLITSTKKYQFRPLVLLPDILWTSGCSSVVWVKTFQILYVIIFCLVVKFLNSFECPYWPLVNFLSCVPSGITIDDACGACRRCSSLLSEVYPELSLPEPTYSMNGFIVIPPSALGKTTEGLDKLMRTALCCSNVHHFDCNWLTIVLLGDCWYCCVRCIRSRRPETVSVSIDLRFNENEN